MKTNLSRSFATTFRVLRNPILAQTTGTPISADAKVTMYHVLASVSRCILHLIRGIWSFVQSLIFSSSYNPVISMDTGRKVRIGKQIAEGGFSFVFVASDVQNRDTRYALKRISCPDREILQSCRKEAGIHRTLKHPNLMPLLGMALVDKESTCYMLFPFYPTSLRQQVNQRIFDRDQHDATTTTHAPWRELVVMKLFWGILCGVEAMHAANYSHRDIKLENILLMEDRNGRYEPVLMDFGSAGPLEEPVDTRRQVMMLVEEASMHTTLPYRPPELLEGGVRYGDDPLDFAKVDVWSLGCTLFAVLYGASPFESEFSRSTGAIRIVDCTQLKVLNGVSWPPTDTPPSTWYSQSVKNLITAMLHQDRSKRLSLAQVMEQVEIIVKDLGGRVQRPQFDLHHEDEMQDDSGIALMNTNFV